MSGSLAMLNESGHTMISWTDDLDDEMEKIVEKEVAKSESVGVKPRRGG